MRPSRNSHSPCAWERKGNKGRRGKGKIGAVGPLERRTISGDDSEPRMGDDPPSGAVEYGRTVSDLGEGIIFIADEAMNGLIGNHNVGYSVEYWPWLSELENFCSSHKWPSVFVFLWRSFTKNHLIASEMKERTGQACRRRLGARISQYPAVSDGSFYFPKVVLHQSFADRTLPAREEGPRAVEEGVCRSTV